MEEGKCGFCYTGDETQSVCGSLHKDKVDGKAVTAHHKCMQYSAMLVQYKSQDFGGFKKQEVLKELKRGARLNCALCKVDKTKKHKKGATSGCSWAACRKTFHYYCVSMNPDTIAKRYRVAAGTKVVILYRVFCSKAHEEMYRKNISAEDIVGKNEQTSDDDDDDEHDDDDNNQDDNDKTVGDDNKDAPDRNVDRASEHNSDGEPANKKKKLGHSQNNGQRDAVASMSSPEMTTAEVISETKRQYESLLQKHKRTNSISMDHNGNAANNTTADDSFVTVASVQDSGGSLTEDFNTSNGPSPDDSDLSEYSQPWSRNGEGFAIVIPSKLDVMDLKRICQQAGVPVDDCVIWPSNTLNMPGVQDKHMPYIIWDIASKLRKGDTDGLTKIFSDTSLQQYECMSDFYHQFCKSSENIHQEIDKMSNKVNIVYKREVCRVVNINTGEDRLTVLFLFLPKSVKNVLNLPALLQVYQWSAETVVPLFDPSESAINVERKLLTKWLFPHLHRRGLKLYKFPKDETLQSKPDPHHHSIARQIQFRLESWSQSLLLEHTVKVMVVCDVDTSVVQYKPYVKKLVQSFLSENSDYECYCVIDVTTSARFHYIHDIITSSKDLHMLSGNVPERKTTVFSAFNPILKPVHCLILHTEKESKHSDVHIIGDGHNASDMESDKYQSAEEGDDEDEAPLLYVDVDEQQQLMDV